MNKEFLKDIKDITLLYVEDDSSTREELVYFLENKVAELYVGNDGEEGYELYKKHKPDLVLTDVQMPKCNGISMSKLIKDFNPEAKIIILTAFNDAEYLFEAIKTGIDVYKTKPVDIKDLLIGMGKLAKQINLEKKNTEIINTLKQYKEVVDIRSIVSKTNRHGVITYVNEPFEKISGYSSSELIGSTHAIIKHEDTPIEVFEDIWRTIESKKVWAGVIKNKTKNGDYNILDTIIKPILDTNGEIREYIALRTDITDLETSKEFFKNQTKKANITLKESIRKAKEYESAIDKSNIILKITRDRKIAYANDAFLEISGYTKEELIGKPYSIIKNPNIDDEEYENRINELQVYLDAGNIYRGKVTNIAKDGSLFHCKYTIFPLKDLEGNVTEYMGVRHDITAIENLHFELEDTQREIIYKLGEIGETRSKETGNHVKRVAEYSKLLAQKIDLSEEDANILFTASPMHDIGKVGIPDSILNKPGKLTSTEWDVMRTHSEIGYNILKDSTRPILKAASIVSYTHHEKWNGTGYPNGLKGEEIHIFGRITAVADVFDALGSERCYKEAWPLEKILELFENQKGKQFEPRLVDVFMENLDEFIEIRDKYRD